MVADSRQVYRGLRIGSNQPSIEFQAQVRHHLLEVADPRLPFNLADFLALAAPAIQDIGARGRLPIVEGGSMLYVRALCEGLTLGEVPPDPVLRQSLSDLPRDELRTRLDQLDPGAEVDRDNPVRMIRAIELLTAKGAPLSRLRERRPPPWEALRLGLEPASDLAQVLVARSQQMLDRGLIRETADLISSGVGPRSQALSGIGYREAVAHLEGRLKLEQVADSIALASHRYARRQMRWWQADAGIRWLPAGTPIARILGLVKDQLN